MLAEDPSYSDNIACDHDGCICSRKTTTITTRKNSFVFTDSDLWPQLHAPYKTSTCKKYLFSFSSNSRLLWPRYVYDSSSPPHFAQMMKHHFVKCPRWKGNLCPLLLLLRCPCCPCCTCWYCNVVREASFPTSLLFDAKESSKKFVCLFSSPRLLFSCKHRFFPFSVSRLK